MADALVGLGAHAVEGREGAWVTHLPPPDDPEAFVAHTRDLLNALPGIEEVEVSWAWQPHEEWAETWKRDLGPRRITERLVVAPSWSDFESRPGDIVIRVDPGVAFGTAEHGSTRGCLRLVAEIVAEGDRVLDLGAGSGILSIAAARLGAGEVVAVEADPYACRSVRENAERNGVAARIRVEEVRTDPEDLATRGSVDGIAANIEVGILLDLLPAAARTLDPDGWLVLGGIQEPDRGRVVEATRSAGFSLDGEEADEGWWSGRFLRRRG